MTEHLPVLLVVLPLIAAPVCLILRNAMAARYLAVFVAWSCLLLSGKVLGQVMIEGEISYLLGGWSAPVVLRLLAHLPRLRLALSSGHFLPRQSSSPG